MHRGARADRIDPSRDVGALASHIRHLPHQPLQYFGAPRNPPLLYCGPRTELLRLLTLAVETIRLLLPALLFLLALVVVLIALILHALLFLLLLVAFLLLGIFGPLPRLLRIILGVVVLRRCVLGEGRRRTKGDAIASRRRGETDSQSC